MGDPMKDTYQDLRESGTKEGNRRSQGSHYDKARKASPDDVNTYGSTGGFCLIQAIVILGLIALLYFGLT